VVGRPLQWRLNVRVNLDLWPKPSDNIFALARSDGSAWNEDQLLKAIQRHAPGEAGDTRAVRNTFEGLAYSGLASRPNDTFQLTPLGREAFTFLGTVGPTRFANEANRSLLARLMIRGLRVVPEYRAIWRLMLACENKLSNEELNRAIPSLAVEDDADYVAERVLDARLKNDIAIIGPRGYKPEEFGTDKESDQRKAMNPQFLLGGAGKIFIELDAKSPYRTILPAAISDLRVAISTRQTTVELSTDEAFPLSISAASGAE